LCVLHQADYLQAHDKYLCIVACNAKPACVSLKALLYWCRFWGMIVVVNHYGSLTIICYMILQLCLAVRSVVHQDTLSFR